MEPMGIVFLVDTETGKVVHTVFEAILEESYVKRLERHYSNFFNKRLFAETYDGSEEVPA